MIVTNQQHEKEEEDFRGKKKKVGFGGASDHIKLMCDLREQVDKGNREHVEQQIREAREAQREETLLHLNKQQHDREEQQAIQEKATALQAENKKKEADEAQKCNPWAPEPRKLRL